MPDKKTYSLVINSGDKIEGKHNNAKFQVNWDFLPNNEFFKIQFSFFSDTTQLKNKVIDYYSNGDFYPQYVNFDMADIYVNLNSVSYNTGTNSPSHLIGNIRKFNLSSDYSQMVATPQDNIPLTIQRPKNDILHIEIYSIAYDIVKTAYFCPLENGFTDFASDMVEWNMMIEFIPL